LPPWSQPEPNISRTFILPAIGVAVAIVVAAATLMGHGLLHSTPKRVATGSWTTYMGGIQRTGFNDRETELTPQRISPLKERWVALGKATISAGATLAMGRLYWGSWNGYEHASDAVTGKELWRTYLGQATKKSCYPQHAGVTSTAALGHVRLGGAGVRVLVVGGGDGSVYGLRARTGKIIWKRNFGSPQNGWFIWSSPAFFDGSVYIGVGSLGDCPLVRGAVVKLNPATGAVQARFDTVAKGCIGATVWTSPAIDPAAKDLYVTTGNAGGVCTTHERHAESMIELSAKDLSLVASWRVPKAQRVPDGDYGGTPTLFDANIDGKNTELVGAVAKNGIYYAFRRYHIADGPVWTTPRLAHTTDTIASSAWDGERLYVAADATKVNGHHCDGTVRALDPATGKFLWQTCLKGGTPEAALTAVPGLVFESMGSILYALRASDGVVVATFQDPRSNWFFAPATVAGGVIYIGNSNGNLYALTRKGE
jgi:outer membrane protein assembly factor BamB